MSSARITLTSQFESAHFLPNVPENHRCRRLHGHTYRCDIEVRGPLGEESGWVVDFGLMEEVLQRVLDDIDHRLLNDVEGLQNPTSERLAHWLWQRLAPSLPGLSGVSVWENPRMRAHVGAAELSGAGARG